MAIHRDDDVGDRHQILDLWHRYGGNVLRTTILVVAPAELFLGAALGWLVTSQWGRSPIGTILGVLILAIAAVGVPAVLWRSHQSTPTPIPESLTARTVLPPD